MVKKRIHKATRLADSGYPTLEEHMVSRRRFLELAGGCLGSIAAGGFLAACGRGLGAVDGDAGTEPDGDTPPIPGDVEQPQYFTLRIPDSGNLTAYLYDGGMCVFYVEMATYSEPMYAALAANSPQAADACRTAIADFNYDELDTGQGRVAAEDDLLDSLETLGRRLAQNENLTVEAVTLHIVSLEPEVPIDGMMAVPRFP